MLSHSDVSANVQRALYKDQITGVVQSSSAKYGKERVASSGLTHNGTASKKINDADLNDRLVDSPKTRSYVPLLSKKLKSKNSGSTQDVRAAIDH